MTEQSNGFVSCACPKDMPTKSAQWTRSETDGGELKLFSTAKKLFSCSFIKGSTIRVSYADAYGHLMMLNGSYDVMPNSPSVINEARKKVTFFT